MRRASILLGMLALSSAASAQQSASPTMIQQAMDEALKSIGGVQIPAKSDAPPVPPSTTPPVHAMDAKKEGAPPAAPQTAFTPSYGHWENSLMFNAQGITTLKQVLSDYEQSGGLAEGDDHSKPSESLSVSDAEGKTAPAAYPSFRLNSILYQPKAGWSVVVNGKRLKGNDGGELQITGVTPTTASFRWQPASKSLALRIRAMNRAPQPPKHDALPEKHRVATWLPHESISDDGDQVAMRFTLKPNQTFLPEYLAIYEGQPPLSPTAVAQKNAAMHMPAAFPPPVLPSAATAKAAGPATAGNAAAEAPPISRSIENLRAGGLMLNENLNRLSGRPPSDSFDPSIPPPAAVPAPTPTPAAAPTATPPGMMLTPDAANPPITLPALPSGGSTQDPPLTYAPVK